MTLLLTLRLIKSLSKSRVHQQVFWLNCMLRLEIQFPSVNHFSESMLMPANLRELEVSQLRKKKSLNLQILLSLNNHQLNSQLNRLLNRPKSRLLNLLTKANRALLPLNLQFSLAKERKPESLCRDWDKEFHKDSKILKTPMLYWQLSKKLICTRPASLERYFSVEVGTWRGFLEKIRCQARIYVFLPQSSHPCSSGVSHRQLCHRRKRNHQEKLYRYLSCSCNSHWTLGASSQKLPSHEIPRLRAGMV